MLLSPRRTTTLADLLRLLALWLAVVLLAQGWAAAGARGEGPRHVHHRDHAHDLWAQEHRHGAAERHHHAAGDPSVTVLPGEGGSDVDAASLALAAAFALLALAGWRTPMAPREHVWRAAPGWPLNSATLARRTKPPRHG